MIDSERRGTCSIMGVNISVTNMEKTVKSIVSNLDNWRGSYICVSNVHTTVMASEDEYYKNIQNSAVMALPDGAPLSQYCHEKGFHEAERVTGPDLMKTLLAMNTGAIVKNDQTSQNIQGRQKTIQHLFYGSTQETLDKLKQVITERYPEAEICGMISPPFRELSEVEDADIINEINNAKPDIVWVGLGAPKQEIWMYNHQNKINALMIGVGAAFDYESGNIKRAPKWMQKVSLEWLFRLMQDPKRLLNRYFDTNIKYIRWKRGRGCH